MFWLLTTFKNAQITVTEEPDTLFQKISVLVKGHDRAVLDSYETFATMAANELGVTVSKVWVVIVKISLSSLPDHIVYVFDFSIKLLPQIWTWEGRRQVDAPKISSHLQKTQSPVWDEDPLQVSWGNGYGLLCMKFFNK